MPSGRGWWLCDFILPLLDENETDEWGAFLDELRGEVNRTRLPAVRAPQASGGTARVDGAGQTGRSLVIDGLPANSTILGRGKRITIALQLLRLRAPIVTDSNGRATITFEPAIRSAPPDNEIVEYKHPYGVMALEEVPSVTTRLDGFGSVPTLQFKEAF
ncbi:MAG: hypothetical protein AAFQ11_12525 [Pseudomonadota bacterium]